MSSSNKVFVIRAHHFRLLANPKRLQVIHLLSKGKFTVSDIERAIGIRQSNLSQHLMILRRAGVVSAERKGRKIYYHLTRPAIFRRHASLRVR